MALSPGRSFAIAASGLLTLFCADFTYCAIAPQRDVGLARGFYIRDFARAWREGEALEVGMIEVDTGVISADGRAPRRDPGMQYPCMAGL
ncbi:hypothetical protein PX699_07975 [Sphingobium sp. H39-3-25]|uniref:hypothetical protein n=1 Tax=Sphingobium arseniciresistens TaxID=3030834 RepID=UPI0023BA0FD2|nr:hypothetical protein [Sphingobium arseniciresistens]